MRCEHAQAELLDLDLDETGRRRVAEFLAHVDRCEECRSAMKDYDRLRAMAAGADARGVEPREPAGGWSAFEARLRHRVYSRARRRLIIPLGLAASFTLAVVGWSLYLGALSVRTNGADTKQSPGAILALTPTDVETGVKVFSQVSQVFDHQANWVLISDTDSEVGLVSDRELEPAPTRKAEPAPQELLLLRLTVLKGHAPVSKADLVIVPGQDAEFRVPSAAGPEIRYRVAMNKQDSRKMNLRVELARPNHVHQNLASLASELQVEPGQVRSAGEVMTSTGRYEVNVGFEKAFSTALGL